MCVRARVCVCECVLSCVFSECERFKMFKSDSLPGAAPRTVRHKPRKAFRSETGAIRFRTLRKIHDP